MTREMKDSGVKWIGEIPKEWEIRKLSSISETITDYVASGSFASLNENVTYLDEPDYAQLIRTVDLSGKSNVKPVYINKHSYEFLSNSNLFGGEIILSNIGSVGNVYLYEPIYKYSSLAPNSIMVKMKDNNKFYYYWFLNPMVNKELKNIGSNAIQAKFNKTQLRQFLVARPPIDEQKKIVKYLDGKILQIDSIISKTKETIYSYKNYRQSLITEILTKGLNNTEMKESGVDWIGSIPKHTKLRKIKYIFEIKKDIAGEEGHNILSVTQKGIKIKDISKNEGQIATDYSKYQLVEKNDFVMNHMDLLTGWVDCSKYEGVTSPDYRVFRFIKPEEHSKEYYTYLMQICYSNKIFYGLGQGVSNLGRWRLQTDKFLNFKVPVPTLKEQQEIVEYLDKKCVEIDNLIDKKELLIIELENYKKSLIYECVTGKKEI
ncbi:MAG: restriction endonuclease subunit S [Paraclostridium bifermentans]